MDSIIHLASIANQGSILIYNSNDNGLFNYGVVENRGSILCSNSLDYEIYIAQNASLNNYGSVRLNSIYTYGLYLAGTVENSKSGYFHLQKRVYCTATGVINNYGFLIAYEDVVHQIASGATLNNFTVVEDWYDSFGSSFNNQKVIIEELSNPLIVGVPYPDVLDIASLSDVTIGDWTIGPNGQIAGAYNAATNEFTPNRYAFGQTELRVSVTLSTSGNSRSCTIRFPNGVESLKQQNPQRALTRQASDLPEKEMVFSEINLYPNPSTGQLNLDGQIFREQDTRLCVLNALGQVVLEQNLAKGDTKHHVELPANLNSGLYFIQYHQGDQQVGASRVQLQR